MTCGECAHFSRCSWLLGRKGEETECDWSPSRFVPRADVAFVGKVRDLPGARREVGTSESDDTRGA